MATAKLARAASGDCPPMPSYYWPTICLRIAIIRWQRPTLTFVPHAGYG